jgi:2-aminoethylphosphonate transport system ATP-binding protein
VSRLSIRGVGRSFPGVHGGSPTLALQPTDLEVADNDFITVLGPSGCGKSTLLRIVAGLDEPSTGQVLLDGAPVRGPGADRGMVFQSYTLFPWLTVRQNICFGLREKGLPDAQQREIAQRFIAEVGLAGFESHFPKQLSGGMQQRVALARALVIEPDVLLLDEPLSALDANLRASVRSELKALHERLPNLTIVCVTHDQDDALVLSDRTLLMREGQVAQLGTPQELYDKPNDAFVARYLGAANLLPPSVAFALGDARYSERDRVACLRPEAMRIVPLGEGQLHGTISTVEWYGSVLAVQVALDAMPNEPVQVSMQRGTGMTPEKGARISLRYEADDVVLIQP